MIDLEGICNMDRDWVSFFELVERLQGVSPELAELALRYSHRKEPNHVEDVERALGMRSAGNGLQEPFVDELNRVNLQRCCDFLASLRKEESELASRQSGASQDLVRIRAAIKGFETFLKERLRAERRTFAMCQAPGPAVTDEEIAAGLEDLKKNGGMELHEFIGELEQVIHDRERAG